MRIADNEVVHPPVIPAWPLLGQLHAISHLAYEQWLGRPWTLAGLNEPCRLHLLDGVDQRLRVLVRSTPFAADHWPAKRVLELDATVNGSLHCLLRLAEQLLAEGAGILLAQRGDHWLVLWGHFDGLQLRLPLAAHFHAEQR